MMVTRTRFVRAIRIAILAIIVAVIAGYAAYRSLPYAEGPDIQIYQPLNGSTVASSTVAIIGKASRTNSLSLNGAALQVDELGNFKETIIVFPGLNRITILGSDQFGRKVTYDLIIYGSAAL